MENTLSKEQKEREFYQIRLCKEYATACHEKTNHTYDGKPYTLHLDMVFDNCTKYAHLLGVHQLVKVFSGAYTHDTIEDTRETFNNVKAVCGEEIAEITFRLTNMRGRTRDERANSQYYEGIREIEEAWFIKICDRLANVQYSRSKGTDSKMFKKYQSEHQHFAQQMYCDKFKPMFDELDQLLTV